MFSSYLSVVLLVSFLACCSVNGFSLLSPLKHRSHSSLSMMFGGKPKAAAKITIKVDNKVIECAGPVNLRKELMANKVDVYPLAAKITGD